MTIEFLQPNGDPFKFAAGPWNTTTVTAVKIVRLYIMPFL